MRVRERILLMTSEIKEAKKQALQSVIEQCDKRFGKGSLMRLGDKTDMAVESISTGSLALDIALGIGGIPKGRIIELYGPESGGKTTVALHCVAEVQKAGGIAGFIDAEHALDPSYARRIGVNIDDLYVSQPDTGEQALEIAETMVRSGAIDLIVIDSVAALTPKAEIDGEMGDVHVGLLARLMSQALRKITAAANQTGCSILFINQLREKVGVMFGNPETTPGGRALKFYSSVRLDIRRTEVLKKDGKPYANKVKIKVAKNKVAPPFREVVTTIQYGTGLDRYAEILDLGVCCKLIEKKGAWYNLPDGTQCQGQIAAIAELKTNTELTEQMVEQIKKIAMERNEEGAA